MLVTCKGDTAPGRRGAESLGGGTQRSGSRSTQSVEEFHESVGVQEWYDGSRYEGQFKYGLKHGKGRYTWPDREYYEGSFYKDFRHGDGIHCWPTGHKFTGKFYLNRKEGWGHHLFPDGGTIQGLYHTDQRLGPSVITYPDGSQDVGLFHGNRLIRLCSSVGEGFSMKNFPEFAAYMDLAATKKSLTQPPSKMLQTEAGTDTKVNTYRNLVLADKFILPPGIENYSIDGDHLPLPPGRRRELDQLFFGELWEPDPSPYQGYERDPLSKLPLQARMQALIDKFGKWADSVDWDVAAVLSLNRKGFGPKGRLETISEQLIRHASRGELDAVSKILQTGSIHPDVADSQGTTALFAAVVNNQHDVIHLLLDMGVDIDKLNCEGISALAMCHVLYYPFQSLQTTFAESTSKTQALRSPPPSCVKNHTISVSGQTFQSHLSDQRRARFNTLKLLLDRGSDPNVSRVPMPVLFFAIMAADVEAVRILLQCRARTDIPLPPQRKGLYPLHVAAALPGPAGPSITELLLHTIPDADTRAYDHNEIYGPDKIFMEGQGPLSITESQNPNEGGRTALHVACQRDSDYQNASKVVALLLSHGANTDLLWSGHSPLSLAIAAGNDLAVDELLNGGTNPNTPLGRRVGSTLCAAANFSYHLVGNRVNLLESLAKAGADIMMPVMVGDVVGTAVDYAYYSFNQDSRIANTPFHALNMRDRETFKSRSQLLGMMGDLLREVAGQRERENLEREQKCSPSPKGLVSTKAGDISSNVPPITEEHRKEFIFCYQCGRSVFVQLTACSRCHKVFYCSSACKLKAWEERHKKECIRVPAPGAIQKKVVIKSQSSHSPLSKAQKDTKSKDKMTKNYSYV